MLYASTCSLMPSGFNLVKTERGKRAAGCDDPEKPHGGSVSL